MNAANEEAVSAFIDERICLTDIPRVIEAVMTQHASPRGRYLEAVLEADRDARLRRGAAIDRTCRTRSVETTAA